MFYYRFVFAGLVYLIEEGNWTMDAEGLVVRHIVNTRYEDLPPEAAQTTKEHLLDTIGVAAGGFSAPGCKLLLDQMREWGGKEESSVLVFGGKLPAPSAALVNGTMGHARDFDDNHDTIAYKSNGPRDPGDGEPRDRSRR